MNKEILEYLDKLYPNPKCELNYSKDYELLLAIVLSAQTTDKRVNKVTEVLFRKYQSIKELSEAPISEIENIIREIGTFRRKSIYVRDIALKLVNDGYDYVPNDRKYIEALPGVGRKTASVVLGQLYDEPSFAVDTHVYRTSKRLGITKDKDDVLKTEIKLKKYFDKETWNRVNSQLVLFGRYYCTSKNPKCDTCNLKCICKNKRK